jgi:hypothetical protein
MTDKEPDDESNDFGRYKPENEPSGEDELLAVIFALVEQSCGVKDDKLDSWAISAYERAIEMLAEVGFVELDGDGRIGATILPKARKFEAWMETHDRRKRVGRARHELATVPGLTPETTARRHDITIAELTGEKPEP